MTDDINGLLLGPDRTLRDAMELLSRAAKGIVLIADTQRKLLGTVTDGDIRRGLLRGRTLDDAVATAMQSHPLVAPEGTPARTITAIMVANQIRQLPIVDEAGKVVDVSFLDGPPRTAGKTAAIMAGGEGIRLRPLTETRPKPMLIVGGRPLLETTIGLLRAAGYAHIFIIVRYLADVIQSHFGDGANFGVKIQYLHETTPMGTAGGLSLIPANDRPRSPMLVVNGDLLTKLDFGVLHDFHVSQGYAATICGRPYDVRVPFGYPVVNGDLVVEWREKPTFSYLVNSGIYCLNPELLDHIPPSKASSMPDLITAACQQGQRVGVFPLREPYHEIGRIESYHEAETFFREHFAFKA